MSMTYVQQRTMMIMLGLIVLITLSLIKIMEINIGAPNYLMRLMIT